MEPIKVRGRDRVRSALREADGRPVLLMDRGKVVKVYGAAHGRQGARRARWGAL